VANGFVVERPASRIYRSPVGGAMLQARRRSAANAGSFTHIRADRGGSTQTRNFSVVYTLRDIHSVLVSEMARVVFLFLAKKTFRPYVIFLFSFFIQNRVTFLAATKNEYKTDPVLITPVK